MLVIAHMRCESNRFESRMIPTVVARRKWLPVNHRYLVSLSVIGVVFNFINARSLASLSGFEYIAH
jgi:hypothetical protein